MDRQINRQTDRQTDKLSSSDGHQYLSRFFGNKVRSTPSIRDWKQTSIARCLSAGCIRITESLSRSKCYNKAQPNKNLKQNPSMHRQTFSAKRIKPSRGRDMDHYSRSVSINKANTNTKIYYLISTVLKHYDVHYCRQHLYKAIHNFDC